MNYSYWENKEWFNGNDFTIVGSGIVGLTCAISLRKKFPNSKIIILEKGVSDFIIDQQITKYIHQEK